MFQAASLTNSHKTSQNGRKTATQSLLHATIAPTEVQQHKNIQSLDTYAIMSTE